MHLLSRRGQRWTSCKLWEKPEETLGEGRGAEGWRGGLATGGKTFIKKEIASLPLSAMGTSMNPSCNAIQPVTRRDYCFWRCDIFPWVQSKTWLNCSGGFPARRTLKLVISRFFFFLYGKAKKRTSFITHVIFLLISSFFSLRLRCKFWKSLVKIKNSGPSLIVRYELLVVCEW